MPAVKWEFEELLPDAITDEQFDGMYPLSGIFGGVGFRVYPYVEVKGERRYLALLPAADRAPVDAGEGEGV
jgi:hypothetical protein